MPKRIIKSLSLFVTGCLFLAIPALSQPDPAFFDAKKLLPTSPEAAMLGRFGEIPIGYYTGTADLSVPFYTIKEGNVQIPVVLRYHGSGVKVEDQAGWVGLGWSLDPEGTIIQSVYGIEDNLDNLVNIDAAGYAYLKARGLPGGQPNGYGGFPNIGNYFFTQEFGFNNWNCSCAGSYTGDSHATLTYLGLGHGQPDIYQYNFAGHSGKFYINPETHAIVLLDKKEELSFTKWNGGWLATTLDGDKFYFLAEETSSAYSGTRNGYTWKLSSVALTNHKTINFNYTPSHYEWYAYSESSHTGYPWGVDDAGTFPQKYLDVSQHNTQVLSSISTSDVIINFNLESRADINLSAQDTARRLKSVDISSAITNKKLKTFNFSYSYFPYSTVGGDFGQSTASYTQAKLDVLGKRLRLDSVRESGYTAAGTAVSNPAYRFLYDSTTTLPLKTSSARDFWGYYNGQDNSILLPDLSFFYYWGDPAYQHLPVFPFTGANRIPDNTKLTAGLLKRVVYPTGGYTDFDYEPNSFGNYNIPDQAKMTASSKQVTLTDKNLSSDVKSSQHIVFPATTMVRFTNTISKGVPLEGLGFNDLKNSVIQLVKISPAHGVTVTVLKAWQMTNADSTTFNANGGQMQWSEDVTIAYDPDPTIYYVVSVTLPDVLGPQNNFNATAFVQSAFHYYDFTGVNILESNQCGARVAAIRSYAQAGTPATTKSIRYVNTDGSSSGKLMAPLKFLYNKMIWSGNLQSGTELDANANVLFLASDSYSGGTGGTVGYSRVEEIDLASDGSNKGKHIYNYINQVSQTQINLPDIPYLKNGSITKEDVLNVTGDTLAETNYAYQNLFPGAVCYNGIRMFSYFVGGDPCNFICVFSNGSAPAQAPGYVGTTTVAGPPGSSYPHKYEIDFYPLNSEWNVIQQKETRQFANNIALSSVESYTYNGIGQIVKKDIYDSKQQKRTVQYVYPYDTNNGAAQQLRDSNWYNSLLQQKSLVNDNEIARTDISYANFGSLLQESAIQHSYNQAPSFTDVTFDVYGLHGNPIQFTEKGTSSCFIWNQTSSYPIAVVKNALAADVAYTSFETDGNGNWTIADTTRSRASSLTGIQSYTLTGSNNITATVRGLSYIISYWSKNGPVTVNTDNGAAALSLTGVTKNGWTYYEHQVNNNFVTAITISGTGKTIDELRLYPGGGQMTSYTYDPTVGMSSQCDINNKITYYQYDEFGRLAVVMDQDRNILKKYCYNYSGQPEACSTIFSSVAKSGSFTRNNCATGYTAGAPVTYTVTAGTYFGTTQAEADAHAQADVDANGQTYANQNGTCTLSAPMIYARLEIGSSYPEDQEYAIYIKFYSDAQCTTPATVPGGLQFHISTSGYDDIYINGNLDTHNSYSGDIDSEVFIWETNDVLVDDIFFYDGEDISYDGSGNEYLEKWRYDYVLNTISGTGMTIVIAAPLVPAHPPGF